MLELINQFEEQCRQGMIPRIEQSLSKVPEQNRKELLLELLVLELFFRKKASEVISLEAYQSRFPEYSATVAEAYDQSMAESSYSTLPQARYGKQLVPEVGIESIIGGKYVLIEEIGEGGMGSVWKAQQTEPVKRLVAIKLIKPGMDSKQVLVRFEAERQALALMDHPNIARVFDGGLHNGRPYFVMELVQGTPITDYCDSKQLPLQSRLELFVDVCHAIHHAHQKGVVHRDIKPSNVLVAIYDQKPIVKVIDFGIVKATQGSLTGYTLDTCVGAILGTPMYMSPEQATLDNVDIDTRSDVYSLGVLMYELLTGSTPFSEKELQKKGLMEILRVVREDEPPRPSAKITKADTLSTLSVNRSIEPRKLTSLLRNELDWIVLKAMEKERKRRYESANGLASDVLRYLGGELVEAHPPGAAYRITKFIRRYRGPVIAASLVVLSLIGGLIGTGVAWIEAQRQAKIADEQKEKALIAADQERQAKQREVERADGERQAKEQVATQLRQMQRINTLVMDIFSEFDITRVRAGTEPVEAVLAKQLVRAGRRLNSKTVSDPVVLANMQNQLGESLVSLGHPAEAIDLFTSSLELRTAELGAEHADTLLSMYNLAYAFRDSGQTKLALPLLEQVNELMKSSLGIQHRSTLLAMETLAYCYLDTNQADLALPLIEQTFEITKNEFGPKHAETYARKGQLALAYWSAGKPDLAVPLFEESLEPLKSKFGASHPRTLNFMNNMALAYQATGRTELAVPIFEKSLELKKLKMGIEHVDTLTTMANLADAYQATDKLDLALPLFEGVVTLSKSKLGEEHPDTLFRIQQLAGLYQNLGKYDIALPLLEQILEPMRIKFGADHSNTITTLNYLGLAHWSCKRFDRAIPIFEEVLKLKQQKFGRQHPATQLEVANLGVNLHESGRNAEAIPLLEEAYQAYQASRSNSNLDFVTAPLAMAYIQVNQPEKAEQLVTNEAVSIMGLQPQRNADRASSITAISLVMIQTKMFAQAEPLLRESLAIRQELMPDRWNSFSSMALLGASLLGQAKFDEAEPMLMAGFEGLRARESTIPPQGKVRVPECLDRLIELYEELERPPELIKYQAIRDEYPQHLFPTASKLLSK